MLLGVDRPHLVHGLADHVHHAAQRLVADGHLDGMAEALRLHAADQAFGGLQRDGAHAAFADVLLHFADDVDGRGDVEALAGDADGGVDQRNLALGKLAVHGRAGHLDDFADALPLFIQTSRAVVGAGSMSRWLRTHNLPSTTRDPLFTPRAAAPLTTSIISLVMLAWRTRFMYSVSAIDHVGGVGCGRIHGGHARGMLGRGGFQQRAVDLDFHVARQQAGQHFQRRLLRR